MNSCKIYNGSFADLAFLLVTFLLVVFSGVMLFVFAGADATGRRRISLHLCLLLLFLLPSCFL